MSDLTAQHWVAESLRLGALVQEREKDYFRLKVACVVILCLVVFAVACFLLWPTPPPPPPPVCPHRSLLRALRML